MVGLIIGGSGSGKSEYAENLAVSLDTEQKLYIATMYPWDEESKKRIKRHREMRAYKKFDTLECFLNLDQGIRAYKSEAKTVFLDCMSNLIANEMYQNGEVPKNLCEHILSGIDTMISSYEHVVIVSNDVFSDGAEYDEEMQRYLEKLACVNCEIAKRADLVVEVVCGLPLIHKDLRNLEKRGRTNEEFVE